MNKIQNQNTISEQKHDLFIYYFFIYIVLELLNKLLKRYFLHTNKLFIL